MLYMAIEEGNQKSARIYNQMLGMSNQLNNINSNTAIATFYNQETARNTKIIAWLDIYNTLAR
jgi:hypothetical protein